MASLLDMQTSLFKQKRESSFLTLITFYSLYHSASVRDAVYQCIQHLSAHYAPDESAVQLLIDAFVCEDAALLPSAFQALLAILKPHHDASQWESRLFPLLQSGDRLIDDLQLKGILPFSGHVIDSSGWCFVQQRSKVNNDLSLLCCCLLHAIWRTDIQPEASYCTKQMLLLCEQRDILERICSFLVNKHVSFSHIYIPDPSKQTDAAFVPSTSDVGQSLHRDGQLKQIMNSIISIVNHFPSLKEILVQNLDKSPVEDLIHLIDENMAPNITEDGM